MKQKKIQNKVKIENRKINKIKNQKIIKNKTII